MHTLQGPSHPVSLAVGVEKGQAVETLVVLWEAAQAKAEGGDALLCEELALLLSACWESLGKSHRLPWEVTPLLPIPRGGHRGLAEDVSRG